jgi:hypothetical protein
MKTIECPINNCSHRMGKNFMLFTMHLGKHGIAYAEARDKWYEIQTEAEVA